MLLGYKIYDNLYGYGWPFMYNLVFISQTIYKIYQTIYVYIYVMYVLYIDFMNEIYVLKIHS